MVSGKGAAWQRLGGLNNDLSDIVTQQELLNNRHEKEKQDALDKDRKKKEAKNKELSGITTGNKTRYLNFEHSITDAFRREGGVIDKYADAQKRLEIDPSDSEALAIKTNIEREVKRIASIKNAIIGYNQKLAEGIATGTLSKKLNEGYLTNMQRINNGQIEFEVDDYGGVKILNKGNVDLDGDGYPDELTLEAIADKNNFGVWEKDFDLNSYNVELKKQFEEIHTKKDDGTFTTIEKQGYNPAYAGDVKNKYRDVLGQDISSLTNKGKSYLYQIGLTPKQVQENPELYDKVINDLENGFRNLYKNKDFETTNHSAKNTRSRNALAWSKYNKKDKPTNSLRTTVDGILVGDERYLKGLENQKLEEQGSDGKDIYIRKAEYSNEKITLLLSNGASKEIDSKDRETAIAEVLKLVRPGDKPDKREEEYRKGTVEVDYKKSTNTSESKIKVESTLKKLGDTSKSGKLTTALTNLGIKGVVNETRMFGNDISISGKTFKAVDTKIGMDRLKDYLLENWDSLIGNITKEDEKEDEFDWSNQ